MIELNLEKVNIPHTDTFEFNLENYDLRNIQVYFISSCSCIEVQKSKYVENTAKIQFKINSKSDLVVLNEKKIYLYVLNGEIKNYFETIKLIYS